jgi:hypothetical protein
MGKIFVFMNGMLSSDKLFLINFIYSLGQALSQTIFPIVLQWLRRYLCFDCSLTIIGALMLHIVPITLMIFKTKISIRLKVSSRRNRDEINENNISQIERCIESSESSYDEFCADIKYPSDAFDMESNWRNPKNHGDSYKIDNFLEELDNHRIINSDGVEILQTIIEDDEEVDSKVPEYNVTIFNNESTSSSNQYRIKKSEKQSKSFRICCASIALRFNSISNKIHQQIYNPLQRSLKIFEFYPSVILKASDIFSYLLFITLILPNLAVKQFNFEDSGNVVYLIVLMGCSWACYAILVLKYHNLIKQNFMHYFHIIGLLGKFFGYLCK